MWRHCIALVPRLPSGREDLYQLPWLYQMVQMALPLLCVAAFYSPTQLQKSLFSFVLSRLKKNTNLHFQEQISSLLTRAIQMHISDIKNQTLPSSPHCCSSLWDKLGEKCGRAHRKRGNMLSRDCFPFLRQILNSRSYVQILR